jgi:anti-sigma factor RsiW
MSQPAPIEDDSSQRRLEPSAYTEAEKFELLSAYLDGECSDQECELVEHWLASEESIRAQYQGQLKLRKAMRAIASDLFPAIKPTSPSDSSLPTIRPIKDSPFFKRKRL